MTKEELDFIGTMNMCDEISNEAYQKIVNHFEETEPCDDCVSRAEVLKIVESFNNPTFIEPMGTVRNILKDMPPVTPITKWIPVSERLPEDRNIVLVTAYWHETYQVMMASYFGEGLWWCVPFNNCGDHMQKLNPKAWQPLPKPYEEKRGNEDDSN